MLYLWIIIVGTEGASINKDLLMKKDYKIKKILLDYEIATEKQAALDYAVYVRNYFINVKEK